MTTVSAVRGMKFEVYVVIARGISVEYSRNTCNLTRRYSRADTLMIIGTLGGGRL